MQPFPHHYSVVAKADTQGDVALEGERLPPIHVCAANRVRRTWRPMVSRDSVRRRRCGLLRADLPRHRRSFTVLLGVAGVQRDRNRRACRPRHAVHGPRGPCASQGAIRARTRSRRDGCSRKQKRPAWSRTPSRFNHTWSLLWRSSSREDRHLRVCSQCRTLADGGRVLQQTG